MIRWWGRILLMGVLGWGLLLMTRCYLPRQTLQPTPDSTSAIYVVRHGWHAGVALRRPDLGPAADSLPWRPVLQRMPEADYLEVGWGEVQYYPGTTRGLWGMTRAGLWPTGSVLHVVPIQGGVPARFPQQTVVRVPVADAEVRGLRAFLAQSFAADTVGIDGYYRHSRFYRSGLTYHVFNNCNHWAAAALEAAGCDTAPRWTFTVGQVIEQATACGTLVQGPSAD